VLHGVETWYYDNGRKQYEVTYDRGQRVGLESFWRADGTREWTRNHRSDGTVLWTRYWDNGRKRTESTWRAMRAEGVATAWDRSGAVTGRATFKDGIPQKQ
jgi:antitoxin component YwqK of YwqJK toxin-antitoxin module